MQEKLSTGIPTRSNTNQPVQPQKVAKSLKFHTKLRCCPVPCMELQQRHAVMICTFIFAYAEIWFYHDGVHISDVFIQMNLVKVNLSIK